MKQELLDYLKDLADALYSRRGNSNYVFFIGGGASTIQKHAFIDKLQDEALKKFGARPRYSEEQILAMSPAERMENFSKKWMATAYDAEMKDGTLQGLLKKLTITDGHKALAELLRDRYLSLVLTTTIDQLIETSLAGSIAQGQQTSQLLLTSEIEANVSEDRRRGIQSFPGPTIVKLCGGILAPAVTKSQVDKKAQLALDEWGMNEILQRNLAIIEPTHLDDLMLQHFNWVDNGRVIYFISSKPPSADLRARLRPREPIYVVDEELDFDLTLQTIYNLIKPFSDAQELRGGEPINEEEVQRVRKRQQETHDSAEIVTELMSSKTEAARRKTTGELSEAATPAPTEPVPPRDETDDDLIEIVGDETAEDDIIEDDIVKLPETVIFTIKMEPDHKVNYTVVGGKFKKTDTEAKTLNINVNDLHEDIQNMRRKIVLYYKMGNSNERESSLATWRRDVRRDGKRLYADLIQAYPDLKDKLDYARKTAQTDDPENLTLAFESPRADLGLPFELLMTGETPLALGNPLCRKISNAPPRITQDLDSFVHTLHKRKLLLKILLISTGIQDASSDQEIALLEKRIRQRAARWEANTLKITSISAAKATYDVVRKELARCPYHLVHCAGQGTFDDSAGADSALLLRKSERNNKELVTLTTAELANLLEASETLLFYLGNCVGAWTDSDLQFYNNDYLGAMDAITRAGVPYVLGFRWHVAEEQSRLFATTFYDHLFQSPFVPERAAWYARKQVQETYRGIDEAWTSPILIAQNLYRS